MKILKVVAAATLIFTINQSVNASSMSLTKELEGDLVKVCEALQSNQKSKLRRAIRKTHVSAKQLAEGLVCNGMDAMTFAFSEGAKQNAVYFAKKAKLSDKQIQLALNNSQSQSRKQQVASD